MSLCFIVCIPAQTLSDFKNVTSIKEISLWNTGLLTNTCITQYHKREYVLLVKYQINYTDQNNNVYNV
jgi:hypothetical protein